MQSLANRIMAKVRVTDEGCWRWTSTKNPDGYGSIFINRVVKSAHKIAYEVLVGPVPAGLELDHLCRNRDCVNPAHLEPVTHRENMLRSAKATSLTCKRGHPLSGDNLYRWRTSRICRTCRRNYVRKSRKL